MAINVVKLFLGLSMRNLLLLILDISYQCLLQKTFLRFQSEEDADTPGNRSYKNGFVCCTAFRNCCSCHVVSKNNETIFLNINAITILTCFTCLIQITISLKWST